MRRLLVLFSSLLVMLGVCSGPAEAQTMASIAESLDDVGYWVDPGAASRMDDADWEGITVANNNGIAYVAFDQEAGDDANGLAIAAQLADFSNRYDSVVVLFTDGIWTAGPQRLASASSEAAVISLFESNDVGAGLRSIVDAMGGDLTSTSSTAVPEAEPAPVTPDDDAPAADSTAVATSQDSGGGFPWVWIILAGIVTFFFVRWRSAKKKASDKMAADMADDRAEIKELLKDRADQVIELGDRAIASKNYELVDLYEAASRTYQDVSQSVDAAETPEAIDALDGRIAEAAWQLDVIEATLEGKPIPQSPDELAAANATPPPPTGADRTAGRQASGDRSARGRGANDRPALGPNESILGNGPPSRRRSTPQYQPRRQQPGRNGMGRSLLMMLAMFLFNSYGQSSRRTQSRRLSSNGSGRRASRGSSLGNGSILGGAPKRRR